MVPQAQLGVGITRTRARKGGCGGVVAAGRGYPVCAAGARVPDRIGLSRLNPQMAQ
jgi:hypothetical protein